MAGFYPDVPGARIPYDVDGTIWYVYGTPPSVISNANVINLNDESSSALSSPQDGGTIFCIFPAPRDISHMCVITHASGVSTQYSSDTTNGIDGTWTAGPSFPSAISPSTNPLYRTNITAVNLTGIKSIKFTFNFGGAYTSRIQTIHMYGSWSAPGDVLRGWHPTLNQALIGADLDFGDAMQGTTATKTFRIKNISASLTANSVVVSDEVLTNMTPDIPAQYDYSLDGTNFSQTVTIPSIGPGAISSVVTVRRTTAANAALGLHSIRIKAVAGSWV